MASKKSSSRRPASVQRSGKTRAAASVEASSRKSTTAKKSHAGKSTTRQSLTANARAGQVSVGAFLKSKPRGDDSYSAIFLVNPQESSTETLRVAWPETCLACGHWFDFPASAVESIIPLGVEECCTTPFLKAAFKIKNSERDLIEMLRAHLAGDISSEVAGESHATTTTRALALTTEGEEMCGADKPVAASGAATAARSSKAARSASVSLAALAAPATVMAAATGATLELSGPQWVSRFPGSRSIFDTKPPFLDKLSKFHQALSDAGANITISATFRPPERAYLMHFAFAIAREGFNPRAVPPMAGVNIQWFHGDVASSKSAAEQMVRGYTMAHRAALHSRHTEGLAIDMTISWSGILKIKDASGAIRSIGAPRSGQSNHALHSVGASYGVIKLVTDPPHWSNDGH